LMEEPSPEAGREKTEMPCAFMLSDNGLAWWTLLALLSGPARASAPAYPPHLMECTATGY